MGQKNKQGWVKVKTVFAVIVFAFLMLFNVRLTLENNQASAFDLSALKVSVIAQSAEAKDDPCSCCPNHCGICITPEGSWPYSVAEGGYCGWCMWSWC